MAVTLRLVAVLLLDALPPLWTGIPTLGTLVLCLPALQENLVVGGLFNNTGESKYTTLSRVERHYLVCAGGRRRRRF